MVFYVLLWTCSLAPGFLRLVLYEAGGGRQLQTAAFQKRPCDERPRHPDAQQLGQADADCDDGGPAWHAADTQAEQARVSGLCICAAEQGGADETVSHAHPTSHTDGCRRRRRRVACSAADACYQRFPLSVEWRCHCHRLCQRESARCDANAHAQTFQQRCPPATVPVLRCSPVAAKTVARPWGFCSHCSGCQQSPLIPRAIAESCWWRSAPTAQWWDRGGRWQWQWR